MVPSQTTTHTKGRAIQIVAVLTSTLNAVSDGMHLGWTSPMVPIFLAENSPIPLLHSDVVWLENVAVLGSLICIPLTIYAVNKFGRKISILMAALTSLIAWLIIGFASSVAVLLIGRFIGGIAVNVAFVTGPIYIAEISDHKIRGLLGSMEYLMMLVGVTLVYAVAPYTSPLGVSLVGASCVVLQFATFSFMPESPYYYIIEQQEEKARKSLKTLRWSEDVDEELKEISLALKRQSSESGRFIDLFLIKSNRKAVLIMAVLSFAQNFGAFTVMMMNAESISKDAETILQSNTVSIIFAVVMLFACFIAAGVVDKLGRKILIISSSLLTGVNMLCFAVYIQLKILGYDLSDYSWIPLALFITYAFVYKYGLGMVPIVIAGELFASPVKVMGMAFSDFMYMLSCIASIYLYQALAVNEASYVAFYIFAASCVFTALFTLFYIPETKGKTLEEIQLMLKGENCIKENCNDNSSSDVNKHI